MKKNAKLNVAQTKVEECEAILDRYRQAEKELKLYENKFQDYSMLQKEVARLTDTNAKHLEAIAELNAQLHDLELTKDDLKLTKDEHLLNLRQLSRLKQAKLNLEEKIANKQDEFQKVIEQKLELSHEVTVLQKKMRALESDHREKNDEYEYKLAVMENDLNGRTAEFLKFKEESGEKVMNLQAAVYTNLARLKELEESKDELQAVNKAVAKSQEQLSSENAHLKGEIGCLNLLVKAAEDSLDAEKARFKTQLAGLQQELLAKTNDYQNLQKYLNDVQNDREEEIKQYELEIEAYKADLKKAVDTVKESECSLVMEREGRASDVARSEEIVAGLNTELEGLRRNIEELMAKKTAMCEFNKRYKEDIEKLKKNSFTSKIVYYLFLV